MSLLSFKNTLSAVLTLTVTTIFAAPAFAQEAAQFDMSAFSNSQQAPEPDAAMQPPPGFAPGMGNGGATGAVTQQAPRQNYQPSPSNRTSNLRNGNLALAARTILSQRGNQRLPVCNLDSFVYQSGMNDAIYGDEGEGGSIPPYFGMDEGHTIGSGINNGGLTTGHASPLPSAWCTYE